MSEREVNLSIARGSERRYMFAYGKNVAYNDILERVMRCIERMEENV